MAELALAIAETDVLQNEYETARKALTELAGDGGGTPGARLALGIVSVRLGDLDGAQRYLESALPSDNPTFVTAVEAALGDRAYDAGRLAEAGAHFEKAAAAWAGDFPTAASVQARSYLGAIDPPAPGAAEKAATSAAQAKKMGRLALEAECRL